MSKNIVQVYADNPITTNQAADLMYFGRSPYGLGDDAAMQFLDFAAQFGGPYTPSALTRVDDTNVTLTLGGTPTTALLQAVSLTLGWSGQLSPARGGTGVNNGTSTLTLAGNLETIGSFASNFTMTGATNVTFPTSGTLATTSQLPTPSALTRVDDTNVTLTLGGTPATSLLQAVSLTLGWTGLLAVTRGGTGVGSVTTSPTATAFAGWDTNSNLSANNFLEGAALVTNSGGTTTLTVASAGQQIFSGATFETVQMPVVATLATGTTYRLVNDSSNALFVISSGSNSIVTMQPLTTAVLTFNGTAGTSETSWSLEYTSNTIGVQSATGTTDQVIVSSPTGNVTLSLPQSIATSSSPTFAGLTLSSPLTVGNGGTGVTSVTTAPTATAFAGWDANSNLSAKNHIEGFTTTATAAGTTTLTVSSNYIQQFTGTTTQTVTMPVASTLVAGQSWQIINNSTGTVTVQSSGSNTIVTLAANTAAIVTCVLASGTSSASWTTSFTSSGSGSGIITSWVAYTPTFTGFGTVSNVEIWSRRVGDTLQIRGRFQGGTTTSTEARITLGYAGTNANVSSSNTTITSIQQAGGFCIFGYSSTPVYQPLIEANVGYITFGVQSGSASGLTKLTGNNVLLANNVMSFTANIPVDSWP